MPGVQRGGVVAALGSPIRRSKLSLKFLQKKETKRALDFSEPRADEPKAAEEVEPEASGCDQTVPCPASPGLLLSGDKREGLAPFVGFNNLGNTCYLNSILQVLYYCPGLREGVKKLYNLSKRKDSTKEETDKSDESEVVGAALPAHIELLGSFNSLITSAEQLQSNFLLNPDSFGDGELATPPRKILNTLRQLNPMYEGYLQHDAQEVLQCILGYIQEACATIRKEQESERDEAREAEVKLENDVRSGSSGGSAPESKSPSEEEDEGQVSGKRKSDTEVGNAKKKPKSVKSKKSEAEDDKPLTRSKRKSVGDIAATGDKEEEEGAEKEKTKKLNGAEEKGGEGKGDKAAKEADGKGKKRSRLSWLRPSGKQPSIFSKFLSVGKISSAKNNNNNNKHESETGGETGGERSPAEKTSEETAPEKEDEEEEETPVKLQEDLDLMEHLFQGQLVLRTRCLECESFTERREDFQDISVPVLDDEPGSPDDLSEVSPDPKPGPKTLKWAIAQFASVERIVGEDKYFCETCRHYTEAERSLLFDKTPEVITIHLKRFSANSLDLDPYAGLSKVNTPLQTPLTLSLEEWCTRSSAATGQRYRLFAVVMHSGVTISSGHYTSYVRMSDLQDAKLWDGKETGEEEDAEEEEETQAKDERPDYDDGEVSFTRGPKLAAASGKTGGKKKKSSEGAVGLLGGQRSLASCELGADGSKRRKPAGDAAGGARDGAAAAAAAAAAASTSCGEAAERRALNSLREYEGKWLLFDDSEVRLFEEEDFLRACSPDTSSTATPYLLFYRRMPPN